MLPSRRRRYNIFVPLVDVHKDTQGTQLWPGSHHGLTRKARYRAAMQRSGALEADRATMEAMEAPACRAGGMVRAHASAPAPPSAIDDCSCGRPLLPLPLLLLLVSSCPPPGPRSWPRHRHHQRKGSLPLPRSSLTFA
jgi:hypothetical protein